MIYCAIFVLVLGPILAVLFTIAHLARRGWEIEAEMYDREYKKRCQMRQRQKEEFQRWYECNCR